MDNNDLTAMGSNDLRTNTSEENETNSVSKTVTRVQKILDDKSIRYSDNHFEEITRMLMKSGVPSRDVVSLMVSHPVFLRKKPEDWRAAIQCLSQLGFPATKMTPVLAAHPGLFSGDSKNLYVAMDALRGLGFRDGKVQDILSKVPELVTARPQTFAAQFTRLLKLFPRPQLVKLLMRCPSLLLEQWSEVSDKVDYAANEMGVNELSCLLDCDLLSHPLIHVQTRHVFLVRSGFYPQAADVRRTPSALLDTPSLQMMFDTTDSRFASRVARLPLEEYTIFKEIHKRELENEKALYDDTDEDDRDDSDSDDSDTDDDSGYK